MKAEIKAPAGGAKNARLIMAVLFSVSILNFVDRQILAILALLMMNLFRPEEH